MKNTAVFDDTDLVGGNFASLYHQGEALDDAFLTEVPSHTDLETQCGSALGSLVRSFTFTSQQLG